DPLDDERGAIKTKSSDWFTGMVPVLTVLPLSTLGTTSTALVRWASGSYFGRTGDQTFHTVIEYFHMR
ncbi:MAG: hypothetical protein EBQ70_14350, partial [Betaproteobacteria bacterium]|nr:hypothetical protein [Betaproteobacteria bacterium]